MFWKRSRSVSRSVQRVGAIVLLFCVLPAWRSSLLSTSTPLAFVSASESAAANNSPLYDDNDNSSPVQLITSQSQFEEQILQTEDIWIVQFFANWCKASQAFAVPYKEFLGEILKGVIRVAAVDMSDSNSEFYKSMKSQYNLKGSYPTLYIFGSDKKKPPMLYKGKNDLQEILNEGVKAIVETIQTRANKLLGSQSSQNQFNAKPSGSSNDKTVKLDQSNFQSLVLNDNKNIWMVAFIAPWCGHCKALMPDWMEASAKLHGEGVLLGVVDATVETTLASQYAVKGFPTIKIFPGGPKTSSSAIDYQGGRTVAQIVQYALAEVDRTGIPKEIPELTNEEMLQEHCSGANKLCVLVALPHILDSGASGRNKYRETFAKVSKSFRGTPFEFLWFEGGNSQMELESILEFTFGYPAVAAISLEKQVFAVQRGSFNEKAISKFLNSIISGRQGTLPMISPPKIVTTTPWDGLDAAPVEEEPLDDIMGEDWGEL